MNTPKHIVIVGGGFAGVKLAQDMAPDDRFRITLIAPHDQLEYHGALYRSATGRSPLEVVLPFNEVFADYPQVEVVNDYVTDLHAASKLVKGQSGREYSYDALVLALGYEVEYFGIKGMREHAESMYTIFDTIKLRNRMRDLFLKEAGKECDIVLAGAGPVGIELAGDIGTFAGIVAAQYQKVAAIPRVTIVDMAPRVLPTLKPEVSKYAARRLEKLGVQTVLGAQVGHATSRHLALKDGRLIPADIIVWTAGSRANPFFERYPDLFTLDGRKRVMVGEYQQANSPDIYVLGDAASTQWSGLAQTAISDAFLLSGNFKRYLNGEELVKYEPQLPVFVVPIGPEWAVAQVNDKVTRGAAGWQVRREADLTILRYFLSEEQAQWRWEQALAIATV